MPTKAKRQPSVYTSCANCQKEVKRTHTQYIRSENHFCSTECKGEWASKNLVGEKALRWDNRLKTLNCPTCNGEFQRHESHIKGQVQYCSKACYDNKRRVDAECASCGKSITRTLHQARNTDKGFCNQDCYSNWISQNIRGENHPNWNGGKQSIVCAWCGNDFERHNFATKPANPFCCRKCYGAWRSVNVSGENHPEFNGGHRYYYGLNWDEQREKARSRDGHKCQRCGLPESKHRKALHVHHIIPFRLFNYKAGENDNYIQANDLSNLQSLCERCHRIVESNSPLK